MAFFVLCKKPQTFFTCSEREGRIMRKMRFWVVVSAIMSLLIALAGCGGGGGGGGGSTSASADTAAPRVISTNPVHQSAGVETNRAITATFSKAMNAASLNAQTFVVTNNATGTDVTGFIDYDAASRTALFDGSLASGVSYTATITTGAADEAGNPLAADYDWTFTTGTGTDTTAPTVRFTNPTSSAINVPLNTALSVTFSEAIEGATITSQTVSLQQAGASVVAGSLQTVGTTVTFRPTINLAANSQYTATITTGVEDLAGNSLATSYSWSFTTASGVDVEPPRVLSVSPTNGAQNVPLDSVIVVNYSEPITPFEFGLLDNRPVAVSFNNDYTTVTLTPTSALNPGQTYTASVQSKDVAGNQMPTPFIWSFATAP